MISNLSVAEFRERLIKNSKYGNPKAIFSPFYIFFSLQDSSKSFFGTFDKSKFELTKKSIFFNPYIISGKIESHDNDKTVIAYEVKPSGFLYYWFKYAPIFAVAMFNLVLYSQSETLEHFAIINLIMLGFLMIIFFYTKYSKYDLEKHFRKVFEIEI